MRDAKGTELLNKYRYTPQVDYKAPEQPARCKNCVWSKWDGMKQYCMWHKCQKEV